MEGTEKEQFKAIDELRAGEMTKLHQLKNMLVKIAMNTSERSAMPFKSISATEIRSTQSRQYEQYLCADLDAIHQDCADLLFDMSNKKAKGKHVENTKRYSEMIEAILNFKDRINLILPHADIGPMPSMRRMQDTNIKREAG